MTCTCMRSAVQRESTDPNCPDHGELTAFFHELATILGGPGQPKEDETRNAYWLRRIGEVLSEYEETIEELEEEI